MQVDGVYADDGIPCACGLLQGCPASPLIFTAIVSMWAHAALQDSVPGTTDSYDETTTDTKAAPTRLKKRRATKARSTPLDRPSTLRGAAFLDDRTIWATGPAAYQKLNKAYKITCDLDKAMGFVHNKKKGEVFATTATSRRHAARFVTAVGALVRKVKLLGVQHDSARRENIASLDPATQRKIQPATPHRQSHR